MNLFLKLGVSKYTVLFSIEDYSSITNKIVGIARLQGYVLYYVQGPVYRMPLSSNSQPQNSRTRQSVRGIMMRLV
jgi:hypothetical protein